MDPSCLSHRYVFLLFYRLGLLGFSACSILRISRLQCCFVDVHIRTYGFRLIWVFWSADVSQCGSFTHVAWYIPKCTLQLPPPPHPSDGAGLDLKFTSQMLGLLNVCVLGGAWHMAQEAQIRCNLFMWTLQWLSHMHPSTSPHWIFSAPKTWIYEE